MFVVPPRSPEPIPHRPRRTDLPRPAVIVGPADQAPIDVLREDSPQRPVDWRWQLAYRHWADGGCPRLHPSIRTALDFMYLHEACKDAWGLGNTYEHVRPLGDAYRIYEAATPHGQYTRWELEALLLANNETLETIAATMCISVVAVTWYEALFFHVRDRLTNPSYIYNYAMGPRIHLPIAADDVELHWKLAAYHGGRHALDHMLRVMPTAIVNEPASLPDYSGAQCKHMLQRHAQIAAMSLSTPDPRSRLRLIDRAAQEYQRERGIDPHEYAELRKMREDLLQVFAKIKVTANDRGKPNDPRRTGIFPDGVELPVDQRMRRAAGLPMDLPEDIINMKFPKSRGHGQADTADPDAAKPDAVKPDAVKPDAVKPDAVKPDAVKPDAVKPDAATPDATNLGIRDAEKRDPEKRDPGKRDGYEG